MWRFNYNKQYIRLSHFSPAHLQQVFRISRQAYWKVSLLAQP